MGNQTGKMQQSPLFSVVILHYNQPDYWREAVLSVLRQDYPALELVFQDDASTTFVREDVETFIEEHKQENLQHYVVQSNPQNEGTAENCDNGAAACTGEYILFLDGDDALAEDSVVSEFVAAFAKLPDSENIVTANCAHCDESLSVKRIRWQEEDIRKLNSLTARQQYEEMYTNCFPVPSCTVYRRCIFEQCGGFQVPYIHFCQDGYFFCHVSRLGNKFHVLNFVSSKHRAGGIAHSSGKKLTPNQIALIVEFMRIGEMEYMPYLGGLSAELRDNILQRYYDNMMSYRAATNDFSYGVPEPAYTLLRQWAEENKIPCDFRKGHLTFSAEEALWSKPKKAALSIFSGKKDCCGCTACATACPHKAIEMREDAQGFVYPYIDESVCVNCGICRRICPMNNQPVRELLEPKAYYAVKNKNQKIRRTSRSGGFFYAAACQILQLGGTVYGAAFDTDLVVRHIRIDKKQDLHRLQGSKYVQSVMGECYKQVQLDLEQGKEVLFSGTACQIDGLMHFLSLRKCGTENLLTIDIVCHGAPSPLILREYLADAELRHRKKLAAFDFRDKDRGWRAHAESFTFFADKRKEKAFDTPNFTTLFYDHVMLRPACYHCPYTRYERVSDITIADFWGVELSMPEFDDDKGVSLVMPHTEKGMKLFGDISERLECRETSREDCIQPCLQEPSACSAGYDAFWNLHAKYDFTRLFEHWQEVKKSIPPLPSWKRPFYVKKKEQLAPVRRVGILTFHQAHNYGAMLQAWALTHYINSMGYQAEIINYHSAEVSRLYRFIPWQLRPPVKRILKEYPLKTAIKICLKELWRLRPVVRVWWKRRDSFKRFMNQYLHCHGKGLSLRQLKDLPYDAVICGSDQIWVTQDPAYYAGFETKARKIAYAPSIGNRQFPVEMHSTIYRWLRDFDAVSVREQSLADYLVGLYGCPMPPVTLDPTLLLKAADYNKITAENQHPEKAYVFVYCVLENDSMVQMAQAYAQEHGMDIIVLRGFWRDDVKDQIQDAQSGPEEFLSYIKNAAYVVTNSFHGTVFSILFHVPFASVYPDGGNNRIDNLLQALNLQDRHVAEGELPDVGSEWTEVDRKLSSLRESSDTFLRNALKE